MTTDLGSSTLATVFKELNIVFSRSSITSPSAASGSAKIRALLNSVSADLAPMWFLFGLLGVELLWASAKSLTVTQLAEQLLFFNLPLGIGLVLNACGILSRAATFSYYLAFWLGKLAFGSALCYLAATLPFKLLDGTFETLDVSLGFHWMDWFNYLQERPAVRDLLSVAYSSMVPQILFAIIYMSKPSRAWQVRELWWASMVALVIAALASGLMPALGAYQHYGVWLHRAVHLKDLLAIRDGTMTELPLLVLHGLITFPSYHSVMAVLLSWVYRGHAGMFAIACVLNAAMLVSVPVHGGHYLVDVISGCAVAAIAIFLVRWFDTRKAHGLRVPGLDALLQGLQRKSV
jgi:hypothetical protein